MVITIINLTEGLEEKFREIIFNWLKRVEENIIWIISILKDTALTISRASYSSMIIIGMILWCMNIQKYYAKRLVYGGILLALITELIS
ncbi:MAG: hypothetical protein NZ926_02335 [Candidatus Methanomethylicia archaeon]|nr:hypothetical protein [Candidatus Methanomethylicia archaeon]MCX8169242.1 hypothetical protein [Candidatus Methanomethylicia archaeon]MDW7988976.1 hypothetical protein [Nitrososphaerota archaeon]